MTRDRFRFKQRYVVHTPTNTAILSDLHLGYRIEQDSKQAISNQGELSHIQTPLRKILSDENIETIVLAGDTFHFEAGIPMQAKQVIIWLNHQCKSRNIELHMLTGNHDELPVSKINSILNGELYGNVSEQITVGETRILHGHTTPTRPAQVYVIGHVHPQAMVGYRLEPCFLYGENAIYESDVLILPAFNPMLGGRDIDERPVPKAHCPILDDGAPLSEYERIFV